MPKIIVVGGGIGGCAAAVASAKAGASVILLERMEVLGGLALVAGRMADNSFPVREELRLMGGYDIFQAIDNCILRKNVWFKFPKPGLTKSTFDVSRIDTELSKCLLDAGVEIRLQSRVIDVDMDGPKIRAVILADKKRIEGDVFIDATGGAGPMENCIKYGNGCAVCIMRCPTFGGRVSIAAKAGVKEIMGGTPDGSIGVPESGFSLIKGSLAPELRKELEQGQVLYIPIPPEHVDYTRAQKVDSSINIDKGLAENIVLVDNGAYAKRISGGTMPLHKLRKIPGLEQAIYAHPYAGTIGNVVRFMAITPRGDALDVPGVDNLFVASEKINVDGIGIVIISGVLAGHNAVRKAVGEPFLILPGTTIIGDYLSFINERWDNEALTVRFSFFGGPYLQRAKEIGLYTEDKAVVHSRIEDNALMNVLAQNIVRNS
jgi:hypothetical protein